MEKSTFPSALACAIPAYNPKGVLPVARPITLSAFLLICPPIKIPASNITNIIIPEGITEIPYGAFYNCSNLKSINFPKSLTKIEYEAFYMLSSLGEIIIPENLTSVEFKTNDFGYTGAFRGTSLPLRTQAKLKQLGYTGKFTL